MNRTIGSVPLTVGLGLLAAALAPPVAAQQLWSVEEVTTRSLPPIEVGGVVVNVAAAGVVGALTAETATVAVELDYLRLGMGYLEMPLADGSVIEAENAVFEDRGNGNLLWTGEVPGAGYESVLFTVQDGHLVGWFGEPGGPKYIVHAGPDGRGTLAVEVGPTGDWCGVEAVPDVRSPNRPIASANRPVAVGSESNHSHLDILVLYTEHAAHYWRPIGGVAVGIQQYSDLLNLVFRNSELPLSARLIPERLDPVLFNRPSASGYHHQYRGSAVDAWHDERFDSPEVHQLRTRHRPDMIYFLARDIVSTFSERAGFNFGGGSLLVSAETPSVQWGWNVAFYLAAFPHEIGHMLGGHHEPAEHSDFDAVRSFLIRPYGFGHTDLTSCAEREGYGDTLICPRTVMSYGVETWDDPARTTIQEPFYSSVRHQPNGWTIGVAGERENERLFDETLRLMAQVGDAPHDTVAQQYAQYPSRVTAHWTGRDTARLEWPEGLESSFEVKLAEVGGGNNLLRWYNEEIFELGSVTNPSWIDPISDRKGNYVGVEVAGLRPGAGYRIAVVGPSYWDPIRQLWISSLSTDSFDLRPPDAAAGAPAAPSNVGAQATGSDSVDLTWRDNSNNEAGFEVWYRKWSGEDPDEFWRRHGEPLRSNTRTRALGGLEAEEEIQVTQSYWNESGVSTQGHVAMIGRYSFVVVAYNDNGFSTSKRFDYEFIPGPHPEPTAAAEITNCQGRLSGVELDGYLVDLCLETPDGARRRAWDYGLEAEQSGLLYFFDRDNVEVLVKVLDGCANNEYRWVFVAPVTDLAFRLTIRESGPYSATRRTEWRYDSERRPQEEIQYQTVGNPKGRTARTVSDTTAFPCTAAEIAAARLKSSAAGGGAGGLTDVAEAASIRRLSAGASTDCVPDGPAVTLRSGYTVSMCYETSKGEVGDARDWGLDSTQSALLYFFDPNNVEVLIKVLDGCGVNRHRWVFVAPVTDLAFNLHVESPDGQRWTHANRLGRTADAAADTAAFPCASSS